MANKHDVQLRTQLLEKLFPTVETVDNLDSDNPNRPLSARQGKVLKELIKSGGGGSGLSIEVVETLPDTGNAGILYLVPKSSYLKEENKYDEYVWVESTSKYELIGSFSTDLDINELKEILGEISQINVATLSNNGINNYVTTGTYRIYGERINAQDGLPILNAGNGHTIEGTLKVYDSSIAGTGKDTDKVVTQILSMSNRTGGDGHIWIRTGQGSDKANLIWSTWEKLQGIFEKNTITDISELNTFTTNGMYSCIYVGQDIELGFSPIIRRGATLLIIVINGYMASGIGLTPQLTQSIILTQPGNNTNYIFTRHATFSNDSWVFQDLSNIVLGSARIVDANIGTAFKDNPKCRINIGTYADSKVNINNAFIGKDQLVEADADSVIIHKGVVIGTSTFINENVIIRNGASIGNNINIGDSVNIGASVNIGESANITDVNIGTADPASSNARINIGTYPNSKVNIDNAFIGDTIREGINKNSVLIGYGVTIGESANIGGGVTIGESANIGGGVTIGESANIGQGVDIGGGFTTNGAFNISYRLNNLIEMHEYIFKTNDTNGLCLTISSNSIGTIAFTENGIDFYVNNKKATLPFSVSGV